MDDVSTQRLDPLPGLDGRQVAAAGRPRRRSLRWELIVPLLIAASVFGVHDVGYMTSHAFWFDETWVAESTRYPLSDLVQTTSSTPIGWTFLIRLIPGSSPERLRLLPLLFDALAVLAAWALVRGLGWARRVTAVVAATLACVVVAASPAMLVRNDLKQYTADAFTTLVVLTLVSRIGRVWTRRRLVELGVALPVGMLVSHTTAFVGVAAFASLLLVQVVAREWGRVREVVIIGLGAAVLMLAVYVAFDARANVPDLAGYWERLGFFLPEHAGVSQVVPFLGHHVRLLEKYVGFSALWLVAVLDVAGLVTLALLRRVAVGLTVVIVFLEMAALGVLRIYPFLDLRTSTFLLVAASVLAAIGVVGLGLGLLDLLARASRPNSWTRAAETYFVPVLALAVAVAFVISALPSMRARNIPNEHIDVQTAAALAQRRPDDVILLSFPSNPGFAYYSRGLTLRPQHYPLSLQRYRASFPDSPFILETDGLDDTATVAALGRALSLATAPDARVLLVRGHVAAGEARAWLVALARFHLAYRTLPGSGGLVVIQAHGPTR